MTNELAIRILTGDVLGTTEQTQEAIEMAVKSLSNTNGETIYRQDAIDLLQKWSDGYKYIETKTELAIKDFQHLPSVQPKHGYWIESHEHIYIANGVKEWTNWYCSECDAPNDKPTDYCPNCGARMENSDG